MIGARRSQATIWAPLLVGVAAFGLFAGGCGAKNEGPADPRSNVVWRWRGTQGSGGPLALSPDGKLLYVGHGPELVALETALGAKAGETRSPKERFRVNLGSQPITALAVSDKGVVYACAKGVVAVDPAAAEKQAKVAAAKKGAAKKGAAKEAFRPAWRYDGLDAGCQTLALTHDGDVLAVAPGLLDSLGADGKRKWRYHLRSKGPADAAVGADGTIYVVVGGELRALFPKGELRWLLAKENVNRPLALSADGTVYVGSWNGALLTVAPDGKVSSRLRTVGTPMPVIGKGGSLFAVDDNGYVYAVEGGVVRWKRHTEANVYDPPVIGADGTVYLRTRVGTVWAVKNDGTPAWSEAVGKAIGDPLLAPDGTLYVSTDEPGVVAVKASKPPALADKSWPMPGGDPQHRARLELDAAARAQNLPDKRLSEEARALDAFLAKAEGGLTREGVIEDLSGPVAGGFQRVLVVKALPEESFALVVATRPHAGQPSRMVTGRLPPAYLPQAREVSLEFKDLNADGKNEILARTVSVKEEPNTIETATDFCILELRDSGLKPIFQQLVSLRRANRTEEEKVMLELRLQVNFAAVGARYDVVVSKTKAVLPPADPRFKDPAAKGYVDVEGRLGRYRLGPEGYAKLEAADAASADGGAPAGRPSGGAPNEGPPASPSGGQAPAKGAQPGAPKPAGAAAAKAAGG